MQISKNRELNIKNLLCYSLKEQSLHSELYNLNQKLEFLKPQSFQPIKFVIKKEKNGYTIMIPQESIRKTNFFNFGQKKELHLNTALKIRFEGNIFEYETVAHNNIQNWLINQSLIALNTYYCILQADDTFDFMIFDVYIETQSCSI